MSTLLLIILIVAAPAVAGVLIYRSKGSPSHSERDTDDGDDGGSGVRPSSGYPGPVPSGVTQAGTGSYDRKPTKDGRRVSPESDRVYAPGAEFVPVAIDSDLDGIPDAYDPDPLNTFGSPVQEDEVHEEERSDYDHDGIDDSVDPDPVSSDPIPPQSSDPDLNLPSTPDPDPAPPAPEPYQPSEAPSAPEPYSAPDPSPSYSDSGSSYGSDSGSSSSYDSGSSSSYDSGSSGGGGFD
jgi:hypothetical protein